MNAMNRVFLGKVRPTDGSIEIYEMMLKEKLANFEEEDVHSWWEDLLFQVELIQGINCLSGSLSDEIIMGRIMREGFRRVYESELDVYVTAKLVAEEFAEYFNKQKVK